MGTRRGVRSDERGASAVEFALVMPILFAIVFGVLQYGLYFFDAHGTRTGIREAARLGVVEGTLWDCGSTIEQRIECTAEDQIDAVTGTPEVRAYAPDGWLRGKPLVVCAAMQSEGAVGLLRMPDGGLIMSKTQMSIEYDEPAQVLPATSGGWSWC